MEAELGLIVMAGLVLGLCFVLFVQPRLKPPPPPEDKGEDPPPPSGGTTR